MEPRTEENARVGVATPAAGQTDNQRSEITNASTDAQLIQREALQDFTVTRDCWAVLAVRAATSAPASELLGIFRGAGKTLLVALDEAKVLATMEVGVP
jgi:hypothetical protein